MANRFFGTKGGMHQEGATLFDTDSASFTARDSLPLPHVQEQLHEQLTRSQSIVRYRGLEPSSTSVESALVADVPRTTTSAHNSVGTAPVKSDTDASRTAR